MRRYMIVANQTLGSEELTKAAEDRIAAGPVEFWVVVPATLTTDLAPAAFFPTMGGVPVPVHGTPEEARSLAQARLDEALERLRASGAVADGEVGDPEPMRAIEHSMQGREFDEILVSTLPARLSRWMHQDLPHRVERKFHVPVRHIDTTPES